MKARLAITSEAKKLFVDRFIALDLKQSTLLLKFSVNLSQSNLLELDELRINEGILWKKQLIGSNMNANKTKLATITVALLTTRSTMVWMMCLHEIVVDVTREICHRARPINPRVSTVWYLILKVIFSLSENRTTLVARCAARACDVVKAAANKYPSF
jgi:hypothetical protein